MPETFLRKGEGDDNLSAAEYNQIKAAFDDLNTNVLTISGAKTFAGAAVFQSTVQSDGNFAVGVDKFNVVAASGNTQIDGTLDVDGACQIDGNFAVGVDKFNVVAASGNTQIDGTLDVDGAAVIDGNLTVGASKFDVTATTGDTQIDGTLNVDGTATIDGLLGALYPVVDAPATLTAAQSGALCVFDTAAGMLYTLPDAVAGMSFKFIVTTTCTSGVHRIACGSGDFLLGTILQSTDGTYVTAPQDANGSTHLAWEGNGGTTGGIKGDWVEVRALSGSQWYVWGFNQATGTEATPFKTS